MTILRSLSVVSLFYAPVLMAQTAPDWTRQTLQTNPPARTSTAMTYDSAHSEVVLFGGIGINEQALNDTWVWDGSNWTRKIPATSPPGRANHAMAYDSAHDQVVLFGGQQPNGILSDTWVWDGANWTKQLPSTSPPARDGHAMAYDSAHGQVVLFGGTTGISGFNDTWVWDGANWTEQSPQSSPSARAGSAMAYDSAQSQMVLFGGAGASQWFSDTWVWNGSNWIQEAFETNPPARAAFPMAYDSAHSQVVLFGGYNGNTDLADTWVWDGANWTSESPQSSPSARSGHAMAYDSAQGQIVLFGGENISQQFLSDTWTWFGGALAPPPPAPSVSTVVTASAFGAFSIVAPGSWVEIYGASLAPSTQGWTGADFTGDNAPTALNGVSVSIGGEAAFIDYVSAIQVNAQLPSNIATGGALPLIVTNANGPSTPVNLTVNATEPGLLAPASFKVGVNQYVVAQHSDGSYVLPTGAISGVISSPAKPGETLVIYGVGFGPVIPNIPAGEIVTESNQLAAPLEILFAKTPAHLPYFGLAPNFVGLYQFNVTVPAVASNDLVPLTFNLGGVAGTQTLFTAVQQ